MTAETKTPLDIALKVWSEPNWIVWSCPDDDYQLRGEVVGWRIDVYDGQDDETGWFVYMHGFSCRFDDLPTAIQTTKIETYKRLIDAAAKCNPYPVRVVFHGSEAVLMLTAGDTGEAIPMPTRLIRGGANGVSRGLRGTVERTRLEGTNGGALFVRESAEAIRQTLNMLSTQEK